MSVRVSGVRWRQVDALLLAAALGLTVLGIILVTSATWHYYDQPSLLANTWFGKQLLFAVLGFGLLIGCAYVHPRVVWALAFPLYGLSIVGLAAVLFVGDGSGEYGARRWVELAGFQLQPSEPAKVALVVLLARLLAGTPGLRSLAFTGLLTAVPAVLIYLEPDLGTAISMLAIWFGMLVLAGTRARYLVGLLGLAVIASPLVWNVLQDYMRARILIHLNPSADPLNEGYNILQAQISIGSGGMWGKGLFEGTQTQLRYLRVSHSDFIFSVLGEELGFVGALVLFTLLLVLLLRVLRAYEISTDRSTALLCGGVACMVAFQVIGNVGSNIGLLPVAGIPLPFVSYGGSALVSHLAALGLVEAGLVRRRIFRFEV